MRYLVRRRTIRGGAAVSLAVVLLAITLGAVGPAPARAAELTLRVAMRVGDSTEPASGFHAASIPGESMGYLVSDTVLMTIAADSVTRVEVQPEGGAGRLILLRLTPEASETLLRVTTANVARQLAIMTGDVLISAPLIRSAIAGGVLPLSLRPRKDLPEILATLTALAPRDVHPADFQPLLAPPDPRVTAEIDGARDGRSVPRFSVSGTAPAAVVIVLEGVGQEARAELTVTGPDGKPFGQPQTAQLRESTRKFEMRHQIELPSPDLPLGRYRCDVRVLSSTGALLDQKSVSFDLVP